jgi:hypothetical protein
MKYIQVAVPIIGVGVLTVCSVYLTIWLTGLVPDGEWASLIKGLLAVGVIMGALTTVIWSAYLSLVMRRLMKASYPAKTE